MIILLAVLGMLVFHSGFPSYQFESTIYDSSSRYEPSPSSLRQVIPGSPTYQSASAGEYEQKDDYFSQISSKQDQAHGDESPRYSPDY